ncbi:MAG: HpcH/HpaI aldolase (Fragment) [uncultured Thiotrichaceae bacterium]|uniref:HpcH/HpaI aldolase n=1 Tax=uncultured Thiotrichaceae bacterium TaxID=298394 RepID=A0A6S6UHA2_9GAMM
MDNNLHLLLQELKSHYGLLSLKAGTEWEDMDYAEIDFLRSVGQEKVPIMVKISGPEAKTDLRHLRAMGVTGILGPMIESEYALMSVFYAVLISGKTPHRVICRVSNRKA